MLFLKSYFRCKGWGGVGGGVMAAGLFFLNFITENASFRFPICMIFLVHAVCNGFVHKGLTP